MDSWLKILMEQKFGAKTRKIPILPDKILHADINKMYAKLKVTGKWPEL